MHITDPFKNLSKQQKIAVIAGSVALGGFVIYRHHSTTGSWNPFSKGSSTSGAGSSQIDPVTGLAYSMDNSIDPLTGLSYLSEADQYGSVAAAESSVSAYGSSTATGSGIPVNPASPIASGSPNSVVGSDVYTSNAAWAQAAESGLSDIGYSSTDVATALGLYLTDQQVSAAQAQLISAAIAEYGPPPVGSFSIIQSPVSTPSGTTGGVAPSVPSAPVTTPYVPPVSTPAPAPAPASAPAPAKLPVPTMPTGVSVSNVTTTGFVVHWAPDPHTSSYTVRVTYQGALVASKTVGPVASAAITGLSANRTYTVHVAASNSSGSSSETNGPTAKTAA